jgi:hypothetical protein
MEIWKDIPWYEWNYQVSNMGKVKNIIKNTYLKTAKIKDWYELLVIGKNYTKNIHRIMRELFLDNINNNKCVNHIDWNKHNNTIENLEWCSYSYNNKEAYRLWLNTKSKSRNKNIIINKQQSKEYNNKTVYQYDVNFNLIKIFISVIDIERKLWIDKASISKVCNWKRKTAWWYIWKYKEV